MGSVGNNFKRPIALWGLVFVLTVPAAQAQSKCATQQKTPDRSYKLLREDEDWSFLSDPGLRQDFWDLIKYIPLRSNAEDWYMTIGGEAREVWEQVCVEGNQHGLWPDIREREFGHKAK